MLPVNDFITDYSRYPTVLIRLFDGDALGEVAGFVHVLAQRGGREVRQQLHGDGIHDGADHLVRAGDVDHVVAVAGVLGVAVRQEQDDLAGAGADFLHVRNGLFQQAALGGDHGDRQVLVDQGDGAVLHLAGRVRLGVDVADLLEFQGALVGGGAVHAAPQEQVVAGRGVLLGDFLDARHAFGGQGFLDQAGQFARGLQQLGALLLAERATGAAQPQGQHQEGADHAGVRLGAGDADLGPGVDVQRVVEFAGHGGALGVDDAQGLRAELLGLAQRLEGVDGLAALGHDDGQGVLADEGVAVAVLAGDVHLDGNAGQLLDQVLADQSGVEGGAARDDADPLEGAGVEVDVEVDLAGLVVQAADQGVRQGLGLLVDLLEHVRVVPALLGGLGVPLDVLDGALLRVARQVHDAEAVVVQDDHVAVVQEHHVAGVGQQGGHVGRQEHLALADTHHERADGAGRDDLAVIDVRDDDAVRAAHLRQRRADRLFEVARVGFLDQVGQHLAVGLALELVAAPLEALFEGQVVLDDAVVNDHDAAVLGGVRVGVRVVRQAVRGPAGVPDAQRTAHGLAVEEGAEVLEFAGLLLHVDLRAVMDGDAGAVVAAVLEFGEAGDQNFLGLPGADVSNDSTHGDSIPPSARGRAGVPVLVWGSSCAALCPRCRGGYRRASRSREEAAGRRPTRAWRHPQIAR